jgi:hypothetical protein
MERGNTMEHKPLIISCHEMADVFGVSQMQLSKYKAQGMHWCQTGHGKYDLDRCTQWFLRNHYNPREDQGAYEHWQVRENAAALREQYARLERRRRQARLRRLRAKRAQKRGRK